MSDYIKREDAIERLSYHTDFYQSDREFGTEEMLYKDSALKEISDIPSADVVERSSYESIEHTVAKLNEALSNSVEVVRCKDCRHFRDRKLKLLDDIYECDLTGLVTKPDNYCNYGEGV